MSIPTHSLSLSHSSCVCVCVCDLSLSLCSSGIAAARRGVYSYTIDVRVCETDGMDEASGGVASWDDDLCVKAVIRM